MESRTCVVCGTPFKVFPRDLRRGKGECCSRSCGARLRQSRRNGIPLPHDGLKMCPTCRGWFAESDIRVYCRVCRNAKRSERQRAMRARLKELTASDYAPHADQFWAQVNRGTEDQCWEWSGWRDPKNYGKFRFGSFPLVFAHRVAWMLSYGDIPEGMVICHRCDNPPCCNPRHLFIGTIRDNNADRTRKGRTARGDRNGSRIHIDAMPRGEEHPHAKLTEAQVREMRRRHEAGENWREIALSLGVTLASAKYVLYKRGWKHVE